MTSTENAAGRSAARTGRATPKPGSERKDALNLRQLDASTLATDQPLRQPVYDVGGHILARPGERLSAQQCQRLAERGAYILDEALTDAGRVELRKIPPEELMQILSRQQPLTGGHVHPRQHERHAWRVQRRLILVECGRMGRRLDLDVVTEDISKGGFAFVCQQYVPPGTIVFLGLEVMAPSAIVKGIVRNCVHVQGRKHRVGVQFVRLRPGERLPCI